MKQEFIIERNGKQFVLFAGLLDAAHGQGLEKVETEFVGETSGTGDPLFIVKARAQFNNGKVFEGLGDASRQNVAKPVAPHILRVAETRAIARALRTALNIGATALDELGEDIPQEEPDSRITRNQREAREAMRGAAHKATPQQREDIESLAKELWGEEEGLNTFLNNMSIDSLDDLSSGRAQTAIDRLEELLEEKVPS